MTDSSAEFRERNTVYNQEWPWGSIIFRGGTSQIDETRVKGSSHALNVGTADTVTGKAKEKSDLYRPNAVFSC